MASRPMLYLLDGHSLAYRHHFALINNPLMTSSGEPTSAIYGFAQNLMNILEKDKPDYIAVAFDDGLSGRDTLYDGYKSTRAQMPDDLSRQIPRISDLVRAFNIPILSVAGYEADDVIGTIATQAERLDVDVRVVSGDGDILQLLTPNISVRLRVRRKNEGGRFEVFDIVYDEDTFRREYGLEPAQLVDLKALKGDSSDNIPGVAGIGDKGATDLLQKYGTIEDLYAQLDTIKGATQRKLSEGRDSAFMSKRLATIQRDVPITLDLPACLAHDFDRAAVEALYREFEFTRFLSQLDRIKPPQAEQMALFSLPSDAQAVDAAPAAVETIIVSDAETLAALVAALNSATLISFDTETTSTDQTSAELVGIALAVEPERSYYIPVGHTEGEQLALDSVIEALRPALTNPDIPKTGHNASYDLVVLQRYGIDVTPITFDTMIAEWLYNPTSTTLGLKPLVLVRLGKRMTEIAELIGTGKKQITMAQVAIERAAPYAAADAAYTYQLVELLRADLERENLIALNDTLEMPLIPIIAKMERSGVLLDVDELARQGAAIGTMMQALEEDIYVLSGMGTFNINSPKQLNDVLFGKLGLKVEGLKQTSHGVSTAAGELENLRGEHPIIDKILQYRELSKLKGTYIDALPGLINPRTGRVHTSFNQAGAATGRMSSSNPNLQNIPIRTELGREIRRAFITPPGTVLLSADYSQVELRIMAHISEEPYLIDAFARNYDVHTATAAIVNGIPMEQVTKTQRIFAKRVNFGILYGMGAHRLARESGLPYREAQQFINTYFERLPGVQRYISETEDFVRREGYVQTLMGRKRRFPIFRNAGDGRGNHNAVQRALREAVNMPIQGTAADIMKRAMIQLDTALAERRLSARLLLQVHDELLLEVPERERDETVALVVDIMEAAFDLKAPLRANAQIGSNWLDMEAVR